MILPLSAAEVGSDADAERRLARFTQFLSADELGGRGLGEPGLEVAAEAIAERFREIGLRTDAVDGTSYQAFEVTTAAELGKDDQLAFYRTMDEGSTDEESTGEGSTDGDRPHMAALERGSDYNPLAIGGSGNFDLPLVFAGYGITADEAGYDDYAGVDVSGKAVIVLRHEPQQDNPHSAFAGTDNSRHATFRRKLSNAYQHGAAAVLFVTDAAEIERRQEQVARSWQTAIEDVVKLHERFQTPPELSAGQREEYHEQVVDAARRIVEFDKRRRAERDPVLGFEQAGPGTEARDIPVLHVRRGVVDRILRDAGKPSLSTLEQQIDEGPQPQSFELDGWHVAGRTDIEREQATVRNVIGILEGNGPRAEEFVVIGAHYDHLGRGGPGSAAPGSEEIHNGADDNASGTAVLVEIARHLAARQDQLDRSVLFIAFTGEERGLLGSAHYVQNPVVPLEQTVAMINLDMVGRLQEDKLIANGTGTAEPFDKWLDELNQRYGFDISKSEGGFGPSDHTSFYAEEVPVLHFFTGLHTDYHKPSDDFQHLNIRGMRRIAEFIADLAVQISAADAPLAYVAVGREETAPRPTGTRPYFGSIPQFPDPGDGYALSGVSPDSPADRAGIQRGDKIVRLGDYKIGNLEDFDGALRKYNAGDRVKVELIRGGDRVTVEVVLDPPK